MDELPVIPVCFKLSLLHVSCFLMTFSCVTGQIRLKKEQGEKERKRKDKAEAHLYTVIKVSIFL